MEEKYTKLIKFNKTMGFFHFIQGVLMLFLSVNVIQKLGEFKPQITINFLEFNFDSNSLVQASKNLFVLPFGILVAAFLFISALAHLVIVVNKGKYVEGLKIRINKFRWYEYAISSSIMIVLIATLFGVYDLGSLILIFVLNACMNLFGLLMEEININKDKLNWKPFIFGSIAGIASWVVIFMYMFSSGSLDLIPWFVWAILITYLITFNIFPINMILQYKKIGKWKEYIYGERIYIVLSLVAKSILAWLVLFGAMQP